MFKFNSRRNAEPVRSENQKESNEGLKFKDTWAFFSLKKAGIVDETGRLIAVPTYVTVEGYTYKIKALPQKGSDPIELYYLIKAGGKEAFTNQDPDDEFWKKGLRKGEEVDYDKGIV